MEGTVQYDYDKMVSLTNELLAILNSEKIDNDILINFMEKVTASKDFFDGNAAISFRTAAQNAVNSFSNDNTKSILELVRVAQIPRNNAESLKIVDKIVANRIFNIFKSR